MILGNTQQFASPEEALKHYGVKGMRWGVRNEDDLVGDVSPEPKDIAQKNADTKEYMAAARKAAAKPVSDKQIAKNLAENQEKFVAKFAPSNGDGEKKGLSPTQKKLLIGGAIGVGVVGGALLAKKYGVGEELSKAIKPGAKISVEDFNRLRQESQYASWGKGSFVTDLSFKRPAFELPAGHTFHRLSTGVETTFGHATYSAHSTDDLKRYLVGFTQNAAQGHEGLNHVTWKTTKPVKVPAMTEVLNTVRQVLADERKVVTDAISHTEAVETYGKWSGGGWGEGSGYGGGKKLLENLKKKGFGAIVDEADAGIVGNTPLVFFGTDSAGPKTTVPITKEAVQTARDTLTEMTYRKR